MPTAQQTSDYAHDHVVTEDRAVAFRCSTDKGKWPWLALDPADNLVIQIINYFALTSVSDALGVRDREKWSALTKFSWRVHDSGGGHATHGQADPPAREDEVGYDASFFNARGGLLYRFHGEGVVFRNRDFEAWRARAKKEAAALPEPVGFKFVAPEKLGLATPVESLVSALREEGGQPFCEALVTRENGFPPAHPYHDGSGDHANTGHLGDAVQQFATLLRGRRDYPRGGAMTFTRYVELGRVFRLTLVSDPEMSESLSIEIEQGGRPCAAATLDYGG